MIFHETMVRAAAHGAVRIETDGRFWRFLRFTEAEEACYAVNRHEKQAGYVRCSAGIRLAFRTDAASLAFDYRMEHCGTGCRYGYIDVTAGGEVVGFFGAPDGMPIEGHADVTLPAGEKLVEIWLPWARDGQLADITLPDGASFAPAEYTKKLLLYGDSITHGCDAPHPSQNYAARLARGLGADYVNKGIGGDIFFPELLDCETGWEPDIVTAAYGTNDWSGQPRERTERACVEFYKKLSAKFPTAEIYAITPIWRADFDRVTRFGEPADRVAALIRRACEGLPNVTVVDGWGLAGHDPALFADKFLHPNEAGFAQYADHLYAAICEKETKHDL